MTVNELMEALAHTQDSIENLEVWIDNGFGVEPVRTLKRQSVFDPDGRNQKTVAMLTVKPWSVEIL